MTRNQTIFSLTRLAIYVILFAVMHSSPSHADDVRSLNKSGNRQFADKKYSDAEESYRRAILLFESENGADNIDAATTYNSLATTLSMTGRHQEAFGYYNKALDIRERRLGRNDKLTVNSYTNVARAYSDLNNYSSAIRYYRIAIPLREKLEGAASEAVLMSKLSLSTALIKMNMLEESARIALEALETAKTTFGTGHSITISLNNNIAVCLLNSGKANEAVSILRKNVAESMRRRGRYDGDTMLAQSNLGAALITAGKYLEAQAELDYVYLSAKEQYGESHPNTLHALTNLAAAEIQMLQTERGLGHLNEALTISVSKQGKNHPNTIAIESNIAQVYSDLNQHDKAASISRHCLESSTTTLGKDHPSTLLYEYNLASQLHKANDNSQALAIIRRNYDSRTKVLGIMHPDTISSLSVLGSIEGDLGHMDVAVAIKREIVDKRTLAQGALHPSTLSAKQNYADALARSNHLDDAVTLMRVVYDELIQSVGENNDATFTVQNNLILMELALGEYNRAAVLVRKTVKKVETELLSSALSASARRSYFSKWASQYRIYARIMLRAGYTHDAFDLLEKSKARILMEQISLERALDNGVIFAGDAQSIRNLQQKQHDIAKLLADSSADPIRAVELDAESTKIAQSIKQLRMEYANTNNELRPEIISASRAAKIIDDKTVVLDYGTTSDGIVIFALSSNGIAAFSEAKIANIQDLIAGYRQMLTKAESVEQITLGGTPEGIRGLLSLSQKEKGSLSSNMKTLPALANYLSAILLEPVRHAIAGKERIIISPDEFLATIPFESLPWGGKPLIMTADISYIQSATVLGALRERYNGTSNHKHIQKPLLVFGAPDYESAHAATNVSGRLTNRAQHSYSVPQEIRSLQWENLPGSQREVTMISKILKADPASIYMGSMATEDALQRLNQSGALLSYRYLLFSAHGYLNASNSDYNSLVLIPEQGSEATDGYVTTLEWLNYKLDSDLVVLSGCETGIGNVAVGDGVLGLPYALMLAGSRATLLSLWSVSDEGTSVFMQNVFRHLGNNESVIHAVSKAKREMLTGDKKFSKPYYWAPFVQYGID